MPKKLTYVKKLEKKLADEWQQFKEQHLTLPQEDLLNRAYEFGTRQELSETPWTGVIDEDRAKTLLELPNTLDALYAGFDEDPSPYLDGFQEIVLRTADQLAITSQQDEETEGTQQEM